MDVEDAAPEFSNVHGLPRKKVRRIEVTT